MVERGKFSLLAVIINREFHKGIVAFASRKDFILIHHLFHHSLDHGVRCLVFDLRRKTPLVFLFISKLRLEGLLVIVLRW